jgi:hypothetical protein
MSKKEVEFDNSPQMLEHIEAVLRALPLDELRQFVQLMEALEGSP